MNPKKRGYLLFAAVSLCGFLIGTAVPELFHMGSGTYAGLFSRYSLQSFDPGSVRTWELFRYLSRERLRTLMFLWMSVYTAAGLLLHLGYIGWLAASAGLLLSLFVLREGYQGVALFACCILPQWLLYALVWKQELGFLIKRWGRSVYTAEESGSQQRRQELYGLLQMAGLSLLGCAVEAYLGLWTMKIFIKVLTL